MAPLRPHFSPFFRDAPPQQELAEARAPVVICPTTNKAKHPTVRHRKQRPRFSPTTHPFSHLFSLLPQPVRRGRFRSRQSSRSSFRIRVGVSGSPAQFFPRSFAGCRSLPWSRHPVGTAVLLTGPPQDCQTECAPPTEHRPSPKPQRRQAPNRFREEVFSSTHIRRIRCAARGARPQGRPSRHGLGPGVGCSPGWSPQLPVAWPGFR